MPDVPSEAQTIRDLILPAIADAGWPADRIGREFPITDRKREVIGGRVPRGTQLAADIVLLHPSGHPVSAVEAKKTLRSELDGVQQAKDYGTRLGLPIVYAAKTALTLARCGRPWVRCAYRAGRAMSWAW